MKNFLRTAGIITLLVVIGFSMAACGGGSGGGGKPSGTYENKDWQIAYTFSGNKVTATMAGEHLLDATFAVKDGKIIFTSSDGKTEELPYSLNGNELKITRSGMEMVFTKK